MRRPRPAENSADGAVTERGRGRQRNARLPVAAHALTMVEREQRAGLHRPFGSRVRAAAR